MSGSQEVARDSEVQSSPKRSYQIGRGSRIFTIETQERFLKLWRKTRSVARAAELVGFREHTIYRQVRKSKKFAAKYAKVRKDLIAGISEKMFLFADGSEMPVHNAQITAMFGVLKAFQPEVWRENSKVSLSAEGSLNDLFVGLAAALPKPEGIPEQKPQPRLTGVLETS